MNEPLSDDLKQLAIAAQLKNQELGITSEDMLEQLREGIRRVPEQMQMMLDSIVSIQKEIPMPRAGWEAFIKSIQYTNEKHGFNLVIKPELLEGQTHLEIYEAFAKSIDKGIKELTESDRRQAIMNAVLEKGNDRNQRRSN